MTLTTDRAGTSGRTPTGKDVTDALTKLRIVLGDEHVLTDEPDRAWFAADFTDAQVPTPVAVARPASTAEVVEVVRIANACGLALVARGGGMSYTLAHTPARAETVVVDTRRMNRIVEINADDRYVTVEVGITWAQLMEALEGTGTALVFGGTLSGLHATVGGTLSQNSVGVGRGFVSERLLALEVVLGDGRVLRTGSSAAAGTSPFTRNFGPDLGGLFVSDSGAFGVKTQATLLLDPAPRGSAFGCFGFDDGRAMARAQVEMCRTVPIADCIGADSFMNTVMAEMPPPPREEMRKLTKRALAATDSKPRMLRQLLRAARPGGMKFLAKVPWSLNVVCDASDQAAADRNLAKVRRIARHHGGRSLSPAMAIGMRFATFQPIHPLMVGKHGEAGFPSNAIVPLSKAEAAIDVLDRFESEHADVMSEHGIYLVRNYLIGGHGFGIEPILFWPDRLSEYRASWASDEQRAEFSDAPANDAGRAAVLDLRAQMIAKFRELGAVHIQIGKVYPYKDALAGTVTWEIIEGLKDVLDPARLVNPGVLGLD
jgi:D-lactate dehydrogenase (cytochrome)